MALIFDLFMKVLKYQSYLWTDISNTILQENVTNLHFVKLMADSS